MHAARSAARAMAAGLLALGAFQALALTPTDIRSSLEAAARQSAPGFTGFSAQRGRQFFASRHGTDWSCASCHSENPLAPGRHAKTGKDISALAPSATSQRFTDIAKVEKWFNRHCNDVLNRACTAQEKGDVLEYLILLGK